MHTCQNCNSSVSSDYVRVFVPDGLDNPRCCPRCEDKVRKNGIPRDAKSDRKCARAVKT